MTTNGTFIIGARTLPPPLRTASDMNAQWNDDVELDFDTAAERIIQTHKRDGAANDLPITDLKTWVIAPHEGQFALLPLARHHAPKLLRSNAFSNLMTRIGAPADFIRRLPAPLQLASTNFLLAEHGETSSATLRLRGAEVSAIVSGRYAPLDPAELLDTVRESLVRFDLLSEVRVRGVATGLVDNLRLILPSEEVAVKLGDVSNIGIDISTSSFGRSAIHISPIVWRLVCRNGLRSPERRGQHQLSFRHVGDSDRLRAGIAEAIPAALTHARGLMTAWQRAVTFMVEDVQRQVDQMRELTNPERKAFEAELTTESAALPEHVPLYSFLNALTASAKKAVPARRLELEGLAGELLVRHTGGAS
jgi:hypothetical protein